MQEFYLTTEFWIVALVTLLYIVGICAAAKVGVTAWNKTQDPGSLSKAIGFIMGTTNFLRVATVIIVIYAAIILGATGKLDSGVSAFLSGIAGYVLGGLSNNNSNTNNE
uniref:Uncharacterized protein n=1 Tax=candidate division WWE3 bacterium TaxID=2053526 RepID=A0A7C4TLR1_UNCKA